MLPTAPTRNSTWQQRLAAFPAELRERRIWCVWRAEERDGKTTKVPLARSNDPSTWVSFQEACTTADSTQDYGVGVLCDGSYSFVDLDKCVTGEIEPWARAVLLRANSYTELSPSGSGLHIFLKGAVSKAAKVNGCEIYSKTRFFTVTGRHVAGTPLTVAALDTNELEELRQDIADGQLRPKAAEVGVQTRARRVIAEKPATLADRETKLERGLAGDTSLWNGDRSAAVHGILQLLARKHNGDAEAMAEEFESSQLCEDWHSKWERLGESEIAKAAERWQENGSPKWENEDDAPQPWVLVRYSSVQAKPIRWMWRNYLAEGKLTMLSGEPSHGKSLVSLDIAARLSCQKSWPDGTPNTVPASSVLLLTEEEDAADTIKPRFLAAGGDHDKLVSLSMGAELFCIESHTERLRKLIREQAPDTKLIILDPVSDYTTVDVHKDSEVRPMLTKLVKLAGELDIAILGINHLNKKTDLAAMHRVSGARAWVSVARLNFLVGRGESELRHFVPLKVNVSAEQGSLDYTITSTTVTDGTTVISSVPVVVWKGKGAATADDLTAPHERKPQADPAEIFLRERLRDHDWHEATPIVAEAESSGIANEKKLSRTRHKIGAQFRKVGMPAKVEWMLPAPPVEVSSDGIL